MVILIWSSKLVATDLHCIADAAQARLGSFPAAAAPLRSLDVPATSDICERLMGKLLYKLPAVGWRIGDMESVARRRNLLTASMLEK
jgi:hypothetical protein